MEFSSPLDGPFPRELAVRISLLASTWDWANIVSVGADYEHLAIQIWTCESLYTRILLHPIRPSVSAQAESKALISITQILNHLGPPVALPFNSSMMIKRRRIKWSLVSCDILSPPQVIPPLAALAVLQHLLASRLSNSLP